MPRNLELKARIPSTRKAVAIAEGLGARRIGLLRQKDTYFRVTRGRLKLREAKGTPAELISYGRPNRQGGRVSTYFIRRVGDPTSLRRGLLDVLGELAVVRKRRHLYLYKNSRIHIDRVTGLGQYLEFEVVVTKGLDQARRLLGELRTAFGISRAATYAGSYADAIVKKRRKRLKR